MRHVVTTILLVQGYANIIHILPNHYVDLRAMYIHDFGDCFGLQHPPLIFPPMILPHVAYPWVARPRHQGMTEADLRKKLAQDEFKASKVAANCDLNVATFVFVFQSISKY